MVKAAGETYRIGAEATTFRLSIPETYGYFNQSEYGAGASAPNRFANDHGGYAARRGGVMEFRGNGDTRGPFAGRTREYESYWEAQAAGCLGDGRIHGIAC
jgi:hypothetical protein